MRALAALLVAPMLLVGGPTRSWPPQRSPTPEARAAASRFLDRYVEPDGRVVRRDQGGDTVSEGQAYAMLLAAATSRRTTFTAVWDWTRAHLQRPDGLLSWHWQDGAVADPSPATDADLDAARALALAAERFREPQWSAEAVRLARAVLDHELVADAHGRPWLVAGPWAARPGGTSTANPSYSAPATFAVLDRLLPDPRWAALVATGRLASSATGDERLPVDWVAVSPGGDVQPAPRPGGPANGRPTGYGFDAVRVPLRLAESCDLADVELAASWSRRLRARENRHASAWVGAAAASAAAGDRVVARRLLDRATRADADHPTYYGGALVAIGRVLLTTNLAEGCR